MNLSSRCWVQSRGSPVIGSRKSWSWNRLGLVLSPHQILQLAELIPEVGVGGGDGLGDGGVDVGDPRLGSSAQVGSAWIISSRRPGWTWTLYSPFNADT